jgi:ABC-2 type transport system ATP-binding protein
LYEEEGKMTGSSLLGRGLLCAAAMMLAACGSSGDETGGTLPPPTDPVIAPVNQPPTADAGVEQVVLTGALVELNGSASDPDGLVVSAQWRQLSGPEVTLLQANTLTARFTAPQLTSAAELRFELEVTDNSGASATDQTTVRIELPPVDGNRPPVANAGSDQTVDAGAQVSLDGSASSDPDGVIVSFVWIQTAGPEVTLQNANGAVAQFIAPTAQTDSSLSFQLTVTDDLGVAASDTTTVTVLATENAPPLADAGPAQTVEAGEEVLLDGRGSSDADGDIEAFAWTQTSGPSVELLDAATATARFMAPALAEDTVLSFSLTVTDDRGASASDATTVTVLGTPEGSAGLNASCRTGENLDGNRSYQVTLNSNSNHRISFQVLEPASIDCDNASNGAHPLILQGHGFGGSRSTSGFGDYRNNGYTVISIDQRGFGDSSGTVRVMDPDFEGQDLVQILDWAERNLDYLAWRDRSLPGSPFTARPIGGASVADGANLLVGATGGSYGGGFQFLLHNVDTKNRLDALAPDIAWHDLRYSLNPGDVIKTAWDLLLVVGGEAGSYAPGLGNGDFPLHRGLDLFIKETLARGAALNEFPGESLEWFRYHSPSYWCALNDQPTMPYSAPRGAINPNSPLLGLIGNTPGSNTRADQPPVDVLLSQGMRDTLFNFNDAWWNYQCHRARGGDVRLITHQSGHILSDFLPIGGVPIVGDALEFQRPGGNGNCGSINRGQATRQWFDRQLRGIGNASALAGTQNAICMSLDDNDHVLIPEAHMLAPRAPQFPEGVSAYHEVGNVGASTIAQGVLAQALHLAGERATAIPLLTVTDTNGLIVAGIPRGDIRVSTPQTLNDLLCDVATLPLLRTGCDSIIFVGLGVRRAGGGDWQLIDDQIQPVRGLGRHEDVHFVGVAERLSFGDELALMIYGYHPQYLASFSRDPAIPVVNIAANLKLPLYAVNVQGQPDFTALPAASTAPILPPPSGCTDPDRSFIDPLCVASGAAQHVVRSVCDFIWLPGVCDAVAFSDPQYASFDDPNPDQPLFLAVGALHQHSGYSDGDPGSIPRDYYTAGRTGHNEHPDGSDSGVIIDFMISSEHSDNEKLPVTTSADCIGLLTGLADLADPSNLPGLLGSLLNPSGVVDLLQCSQVTETDHYHKWEATLRQAMEGTETEIVNGRVEYTGFTGLRGFEWTNDYYNHLNVYFSTNVVNAKVDGSYAGMDFMWRWLQKPVSSGGGADALVTFNHPGGLPKLTPFDGGLPHNELLQELLGGANWNDIAYVPEVDANVVGIEVNGGRHVPWYLLALYNGWHLGPVAAEDEHQRKWSSSQDGKTLMLTRGRSPRDYYFAMRNRRTIAITASLVQGQPGTRAQVPEILYWANGDSIQNGAPLGSILSDRAQHTLHVSVDGLPNNARVVLVGSAEGQNAPIPLGTAQNGRLQAQHVVAAPSSGEDWYFVFICPASESACGRNQNYLALTAPIWIGAHNPQQAATAAAQKNAGWHAIVDGRVAALSAPPVVTPLLTAGFGFGHRLAGHDHVGCEHFGALRRP